MGNPWDRDAIVKPGVVASVGAPPAKPSAGFAPAGSPVQQQFIPGSETDPAYITRKAQIEADANASAQASKDIRVKAATAPIDLNNDIAKMKAERLLKSQPVPLSPEQRIQSQLGTDDVITAINQARGLISDGHSTGLPGQILSHVGGTNARDLTGALNTIKANLAFDTLKAMRQSSPTGGALGSVSDAEERLLSGTVGDLDQAQSSDKLLQSLALIEKHYRGWLALNNNEDPRDPTVQKRYGIVSGAPNAPNAPGSGPGGPNGGNGLGDPFGGPSQTDMAPSQGLKTVADPTLAGVNMHVNNLIASGASGDDVRKYLDSVQPGLSGNAQNIDAWVKYHQQKPKAPIAVDLETKQVPLAPTQQMLNGAAQTGPGAYFMGAGDAITGSYLDNLTSNPAQARAAELYASKAHPWASNAGELSGAVLDNALLASGGTALGLGKYALPTADALYGGAYGSGASDDGSRVAGAIKGAAIGAAAGQGARMAFRGVGNAIRGVQNPDVQALRGAGVDNMTLGQIVGDSGPVGQYIKAVEDRNMGFAGIGDTIKNQRNASLRSFNQAAFNQGLAPVGGVAPGVGEQGVENAISSYQNGYGKALNGVSVQPDAQFATDYGNAVLNGSNVSRTGPDFTSYVNDRFAPIVQQPTISGPQIQDMLQGVQKADFGSDSMGQMAKNSVNDIGGAFSDLVDRQAPNAIPDLANANNAYRNTNILADAVGKAMNSEGVFSPAQLGQAARTNATKFGGKIAAATTDRPFYDLQRAGQNVLPSEIADSGTAGRVQSFWKPNELPRIVAQTAMKPVYSKTLNPLLNTILLDRPNAAVNIGDFINQTASKPIGMFGNALGLRYAYNPY